MKALSLAIFLCLVLQNCAQTKDRILTASEKLTLLESRTKAFQALNEKIRDPFINIGPDGRYYLTGTTAGSHWGETVGIRVWRSDDLAEWEDLGFVWELEKDGKPANSWHFQREPKNPEFKNPRAIWAPEIHYLSGTWWLPHCMNGGGHGLLKSTTGKVEGPYEALPAIGMNQIDPFLFKDGNEVFYCWQADKLAKMNPAMDSLVEEVTELQHDGNHPLGYEGIFMMKMGNKYVHIASGRYGYEPTNTYDLYYAISDNLYGPYGKRRMAIKNAGHGNLFQDNAGNWWSTAFDHEFTTDEMERWSLWLVPVEIMETENDVLFKVLDERFAPTQEDQDFVKQLATEGVPNEWKDKRPWWRPEK